MNLQGPVLGGKKKKKGRKLHVSIGGEVGETAGISTTSGGKGASENVT